MNLDIEDKSIMSCFDVDESHYDNLNSKELIFSEFVECLFKISIILQKKGQKNEIFRDFLQSILATCKKSSS